MAKPSNGVLEADASTPLDDLVRGMEPISLEEMDSSARLMNRVDTKFVFNEDQLLSLLERLKSDYRVLEVGGIRLAPYATLYFDTPDRSCYREHHNGRKNRRKFRVREYLSSGVCFLEVKTKNNKGRTDKRRITLSEFEESISSPSADFIQSITGRPLPLEPQLWTYFSRITLVSRTGAERATIDTGLHFRRAGAEVELPGITIAEVKQESNNRNTLVCEELRRLAIRPLRVSKYCLGSCLVDPQLKQNRFKRKLLAIQRMV